MTFLTPSIINPILITFIAFEKCFFQIVYQYWIEVVAYDHASANSTV
jgi:hypothetical protein